MKRRTMLVTKSVVPGKSIIIILSFSERPDGARLGSVKTKRKKIMARAPNAE
jgi:hypothetical protein